MMRVIPAYTAESRSCTVYSVHHLSALQWTKHVGGTSTLSTHQKLCTVYLLRSTEIATCHLRTSTLLSLWHHIYTRIVRQAKQMDNNSYVFKLSYRLYLTWHLHLSNRSGTYVQMTVPFFKKIHMFVSTNYDGTFYKNVIGLIAVF